MISVSLVLLLLFGVRCFDSAGQLVNCFFQELSRKRIEYYSSDLRIELQI
ncbi:hypothetical protein CAEBREN_31950 [Caenorhabditis brenneri]|uniref:Uncharacterized protein n=1 Tax=Caenorhabditis brenneri TaxID=135651 RepID=G0NWZ2_CAEBE|nr:hypothetical protein CAEBREN_31950 [Caenorhabditis brenneri]